MGCKRALTTQALVKATRCSSPTLRASPDDRSRGAPKRPVLATLAARLRPRPAALQLLLWNVAQQSDDDPCPLGQRGRWFWLPLHPRPRNAPDIIRYVGLVANSLPAAQRQRRTSRHDYMRCVLKTPRPEYEKASMVTRA